MRLEQADGTKLEHYGQRRGVKMRTGHNQKMTGNFDVRDVSRPIVAAGELTDGGQGLWFHRDQSYIISQTRADEIAEWMKDEVRNGEKIYVDKRKGVFEVPIQTV